MVDFFGKRKIQELQDTIASLKIEAIATEKRLNDLLREIDSLKSVIDQKEREITRLLNESQLPRRYSPSHDG